VTTRKNKLTARQYFRPDEKLIQTESTRFRLSPAKLRAVLSAFGPLPNEAQRKLLLDTYSALGRYQFRAMTVQVITAGTQRDQLKIVKATARKLLSVLGVKHKKVSPLPFWENWPGPPWSRLKVLGKLDAKGEAILMQLATAGIKHRNRDAARVNTELQTRSNRTAEVVISLLWLRSQAELAEQSLRPRKGRGGSRNRPTPKGALIRDAITMYSRMREQHPNSGNKPGFGGPMVKFIKAVAHLASVTLTDKQIEDVWRVRVSKRN
jgi:hypothetical protein